MTLIFGEGPSYGEGVMDEEVRGLCDAMNCLPGIQTTGSCCGHGKAASNIWFTVGPTLTGLFFLTRCVDARYWMYGHLWEINLSVADAWDGKTLPTMFRLHSGDVVGIDAYSQALDLVRNMEEHLNHPNFLKAYALSIQDFKTRRA
jgi:hypothetical protein